MPRIEARDPGSSHGDDLATILRQVRRIELRTRRLVSSLTSGGYRSAFKGTGLEFDEVREYSPGDDVRHIDWNVTARAGKAYVKVFREERELSVLLLVDVSGSMRFGAIPGISPRAKQALAAEAAASVAVNAMRNRDRIGLVLFSDRTESHLAARRGRGHSLRLVREVLAHQTKPRRADPSHALDELARVTKRRSVAFLVSDFLDLGNRFPGALARASRRHDVIGLRVTDPAEESLPDGPEPLVFADPEGSGELVLRGGSRSRQIYRSAWQRERRQVDEAFRGAGCDLVDLRTDGSATSALMRFFAQRRRRIRG